MRVEARARGYRVIVGVVEVRELLERQRRDRVRVATRVDGVRVVGEGRLLRGAVQQRVGRRVDALHLVEHHALVRERVLQVLQLVVPPLLLEDRTVVLRARVKHRVEVHVDEVVEVLGVLRRHRVARAVGVREGVEEGLERALEQLCKGLLGRVLVAATQHAVLENMRHAGRVGHLLRVSGGVRTRGRVGERGVGMGARDGSACRASQSPECGRRCRRPCCRRPPAPR